MLGVFYYRDYLSGNPNLFVRPVNGGRKVEDLEYTIRDWTWNLLLTKKGEGGGCGHRELEFVFPTGV